MSDFKTPYKQGRKGYKLKKLKNIHSKLPNVFTTDDVRNELQKYNGLTKVSNGTVNIYVRNMINLNLCLLKSRAISKKSGDKNTYQKT